MEPVYVVALLLAIGFSLWVVRWIDRPDGSWGDALRSRLILGVPWGTLVSIGLVLLVYLFIQDGRTDIYNPVTLPFRAWSYSYPTGWLTAGFAHNSFNHLVGNLTATLILGALAEYAFSHYPRERGTTTFSSYWTNPYVRAFLIFPGAVVGLGLLTGLFALGPIIGFSGVVWSFAGFALVRYPLTTVLSIFIFRALRRIHEAMRRPEVIEGIAAPPPAPPWWAEVAIQGHAIGLLFGVLLGLYLFRRRGAIPPAWRLWLGAFLFGITQGLWAIYWFQGLDRYLLLQGLGVVAVIVLATLLVAAIAGPDRPIRFESVTARQLALGVLAIALAAMIGPAIAVNLVGPDPTYGDDLPGVEIADYRVVYAEDVTNRMVVVLPLEIGGLSDVRTSGVIIMSEERQIWTQAVSKQQLMDRGRVTVTVGGVGWRQAVSIDVDTWQPVGNDSVYQVWVIDPDDGRVHAHASEERTADVQVANRTITILIEDETFLVAIDEAGERLVTTEMPRHDEAVFVEGMVLRNVDGTLYLEYDGTVVPVAERAN